MEKFVKTSKGTELPLINLKGKAYMQVAHRLVWFVEENPQYRIETDIPVQTGDSATARVTIKVFDGTGNLVRQAQDWKTESKAHFTDFLEKAVTGAMGRALSQLGYGTAYALADLDEGERIVDAPQEKVVSIEKAKKVAGSFNQDKKVNDEEGW